MLSLWKYIIISLIVMAVITIINIGTRNMLILLFAFEMIFFAISVGCIAYFYLTGKHWNYDLLFMAIAVTVVAAAETAIALALLTRIYKQTGNIRFRRKGRRN